MIQLNNNNKNMSILSSFSKEEIDDVISENPNLRGYIQGYLAEVALKKYLMTLPHVTEVTKIPDSSLQKGDLKVTYKNVIITIEVKSLLTKSIKSDVMHDTWQGVVGIKNSDKREIEIKGLGTIQTTSLVRGEFDILAISCYAVSGKWDCVFMENEYLPPKDYANPELLKVSFVVNPETTPCLDLDLKVILEKVYNKKQTIC